MDPNALHYQSTDENEPLYRAALLAAGAVGLLVVMALGINFVIHHSGNAASPSVRRDSETSPDDSINGMRHELSDETSQSPVATQASASSVGVNFGSTSNPTLAQNESPNFGNGVGFSAGPATNGPGRGLNIVGNAQLHPIRGSIIRDWASISPDNISALLNGR